MSKKRPPKLKSIIPDEQRYEASIRLILNDLKKLTRKYISPILEPVTNKIAERLDEQDEERFDDEVADIKTAIGKIKSAFNKRYSDADYRRTAKDSAKRVNKTNSQNNSLMMTTLLKVEPAKLEPWLGTEIDLFVESNASLIKTLPTEALSDIEQMLYRDSRRGLSPQELKKQIKELFDTTDSQAALIARDQVGKFNGSLTEIRQTKAGITEYEWLTSSDGRVRPDHDRLNHNIQRWDKPPITVTTGKRSGERNHPSQDIQCRCQAIPVIPKLKK